MTETDPRLLSAEELQAIPTRACELLVSEYVSIGTGLLAMERHLDALAERLAAVTVERDNAQAVARGALASVEQLTAERLAAAYRARR